MRQLLAICASIGILFGLFFPVTYGQATSLPTENSQESSNTASKPAPIIIQGAGTIQVGKRLILSIDNPKANAEYTWDLGTGNKDTGDEIVAIFDTPGSYTIQVTERIDEEIQTVTQEIFAYQTVITLIYNGDPTLLASNLKSMEEEAKNKGIYVNIAETRPTSALFSGESDADTVLKQRMLFLESSTLIGGPDGKNILSVLSRITQNLNEEEINKLQQSQVLISTKSPLPIVGLIAEKLKGIIPMENIHLTTRDPFSLLQSAIVSESDVLDRIPKEEQMQIGKSTAHPHPYLVLSQLVASTIQAGIPQEAIAFILFMPFILVILTFLKQIIGLETIGVYHTMVLTLCFLLLGVTRGSITLASIFIIGLIGRLLFKRLRILYSSKQALMHAMAAVWILFLLALGAFQGIFFGLDTSTGDETLLALLPMLLIALQSDKLTLITLKQRDRKEDAIRLLSTYIVVLTGYMIVRFDLLEMLLFALPETVLLAFLLIYTIGRYAGLRGAELVRFRELFKHETEE